MIKLILAFVVVFLLQVYCAFIGYYEHGDSPSGKIEAGVEGISHFLILAGIAGLGIWVVRSLSRENASRQAAEEKTRAQGQRIDTILAAAGISIWEHDLPTGVVRRHRYEGTTLAQEDSGTTLEELERSIHPEDRERFAFSYLKEIEGDATSYDAHYQIQTEAGDYLDVINRGAILRDASGKAQEAIGATIDLTRQRRIWENQRHTLEALEHVCRSRSEFLATMGHELRTPLNSILGFSELLEAQMFGSLNDRQLKYIKNVVAGARRLQTLINDVLMIAKGDSGTEELVLTQVEVHVVLREVAALFTLPLRRKNLEIHFLCPEALFVGMLDRSGLKRAIFCLIDNAIKFSTEGGLITVSARILSPRDEKEQLEIEIQDFGSGIRTEDQERIFLAFERLDSTLDQIQGGIGMGLPNAREIARRHDGTLTVESSGIGGEGSLFSLRLPITSHLSNTAIPSEAPLLATHP